MWQITSSVAPRKKKRKREIERDRELCILPYVVAAWNFTLTGKTPRYKAVIKRSQKEGKLFSKTTTTT